MNELIATDFKEAMKNGDKFTLSVLRMLKSAIQMEQINKKHELNDEEIIAVIKKQVKVRKDSLLEYEKYNKVELVDSLIELETLPLHPASKNKRDTKLNLTFLFIKFTS